MYKLEIETNKTVKRIKNPRKVDALDLIFTALVRVMDDDGKWKVIGHTFFISDAQLAAAVILQAISEEASAVVVDLN